MAHENSPSSVMYADFKAFGLLNRDIAATLLDTQCMLGGVSVQDRIASKTQLSRYIVHVAPGDAAAYPFVDFTHSSQRVLSNIFSTMPDASPSERAQRVIEHYTGPAADAMQEALDAYGLDGNVYRNALAHIENLRVDRAADRALLYLMIFVVCGCTGDPHEAARVTDKFATEMIGTSFRTTEAHVDLGVPSGKQDTDDQVLIGLMRIVDGKLVGARGFHSVSPTERGTEIGSLAESENAITDVDEDVSRHHARIYLKDGRWYIIGLKSTNGTTVISGEDKIERVVEPPRKERAHGYEPQPMEILPTDTICLGASTRYMVMPVLG